MCTNSRIVQELIKYAVVISLCYRSTLFFSVVLVGNVARDAYRVEDRGDPYLIESMSMVSSCLCVSSHLPRNRQQSRR